MHIFSRTGNINKKSFTLYIHICPIFLYLKYVQMQHFLWVDLLLSYIQFWDYLKYQQNNLLGKKMIKIQENLSQINAVFIELQFVSLLNFNKDKVLNNSWNSNAQLKNKSQLCTKFEINSGYLFCTYKFHFTILDPAAIWQLFKFYFL